MIKTNIPEINVDELMEKIKAEVRRRKEREETVHGPAHQAGRASQPAPSPRIDPLNIESIPESQPFEFKEDGYHINDFLKYHDQGFVINTYRGILKRPPDSGGRDHFLEHLRTGMTKAEILGRVRYSSEGRAIKVKIKGLFWPFAVQSSFRIPVLGYLLRIAVGIVQLPTILRNLQILEEGSFSGLSQLREHQNATARVMQDKVNNLIGAYKHLNEYAQSKANKEDLTALSDQKADLEALEELSDKKADRAELTSLASAKKFAYLKRDVVLQERRLSRLLEEARKRLPEPFDQEQLQAFAKEEDHLLDSLYVSFEDQFRGTRQDIKDRAKVYLPLVQEAKAGTKERPIMDVGCGRGEWLELLNEEGFTARGVDFNRVLVEQCRKCGIDVVESDVFEYLHTLPDVSLGAVTGLHIIEHLPLGALIKLIDETVRVLKPGGVAIFETPNPENILVGACTFYFDPTHCNPLPAPMIKFLVESRGLCQVEIKRLHPYDDASRVPDNSSELAKRFNEYFYGPQDYAVVGYKL